MDRGDVVAPRPSAGVLAVGSRARGWKRRKSTIENQDTEARVEIKGVWAR